VREGSPAAQILLRPGDVISKIDDKEVKNDRDIESAVAASASGTIKVAGLTETAIGMIQFEREIKVR
jgi:S1-C subfamily serine protease